MYWSQNYLGKNGIQSHEYHFQELDFLVKAMEYPATKKVWEYKYNVLKHGLDTGNWRN